ncbi:protein of unknown function [Propionibacterium freudenreichii]|nr:protein of unknown function [Propionibacterium freudenreichii]CEH00576.1 Protein of unknown function [Propionibacterium freudenreichii]
MQRCRSALGYLSPLVYERYLLTLIA